MSFDRPTVQLFFNRTSGGHCPKRLVALRERFEAGGAHVILSECGPGSEVSIGEGVSHICTLGGDGTVRHVAFALARSGRALPMSIYPTGTVNLLHREIGSPIDLQLHAERVLGGTGAGRLYPVAINDTHFLACASVGPDSRAVASVSLPLKRRIGKLAYLWAFIGLLLRWERQPIRLQCGTREVTCEAFYVAKGRFFAGPWSFAPDALLSEPLLHVTALVTARRRDYLAFVWAMLRGRRIDALPGVTSFTCTDFSAQSPCPLPVQADGDIVAELPIRVQLCAEAIALC